MLKSHEKFHSVNGKRLILVADDEMINRELLGAVLENDYEVIFAADGQETLEKVKQNKDDLSLLLLDLMMPVKPGFEVLKELKADQELHHIPVIVMTADQDAEIDSLTFGAIDYIPKPYPQPGIILARVLRAIELSEDREIIQSTEKDSLTGLYNREYFYSYAEQYDQHHKGREMDAIVVDINHFHMINERFGTSYGDEVLRKIGQKIKEAVVDSDGIVCRRSADTFLVYCPHGVDYKKILDNASVVLLKGESVNNYVRLRMGVYEKVDKSLEMVRRFDRAKLAADTVRNNFSKAIGMYDNAMHDREVYIEQLMDSFPQAIKEKQFEVYFQPKFDVRPAKPVLASAEALVRWNHPQLGFISPGMFIPLFEDNGLIQELDTYVWRETLFHIRDWRDRLGFSVPVSVNVSRIDMYDPNLMDKFDSMLAETGLAPEDLLLEITESAYTQDSTQIIETVRWLREKHFRIEMDDFGTGYSSLNMISSLPIDALKLDMQFVRSAFKDQKDTRMLEVIIEIADHLSVPVIAEGVETEEQYISLKELGCDIIQGYYFSKPVPAKDFEPFLLERKDLPEKALIPEKRRSLSLSGTEDLESIDNPEPVVPPKKPLRLRSINILFAVLVSLLTISLAICNVRINRQMATIDSSYQLRSMVSQAAANMEAGSDYLTVSARSFVVLQDLKYLNDYFREVKETQRRDKALDDMEILKNGDTNDAYKALDAALQASNDLMNIEYQAMSLIRYANNIPDSDVPEEISSYVLPDDTLALSPDEMRSAATSLVFGEKYMTYKDTIRNDIAECTENLVEYTSHELESAKAKMNRLMTLQAILLAVLLTIVLAKALFITLQIRNPLINMLDLIRHKKKVVPYGVAEIREVAEAYNEMYDESKRAQAQLTYEASHDPLTGLLNRSAYEVFMQQYENDNIALLIIDIDYFKTINDTYGHDVGDKVLIKVSDLLKQSFRSVDAVCRIGGDEFAVIMTRANPSMRQLIINKIENANNILSVPENGLPKCSLSVGAAFSDRNNPSKNLFKDADTALYRVKNSGRRGCGFFE